MKLKTDIHIPKILRERGLGKDQAAALFFGQSLAKRADKRVPFDQGNLKNNRKVYRQGNGVVLEYTAPYAHYHYHGEVMAGRAPKTYTGRAIHHQGAPMRGPKWDVRTMQAEGDELMKDLKQYLAGRGKA